MPDYIKQAADLTIQAQAHLESALEDAESHSDGELALDIESAQRQLRKALEELARIPVAG